MPRFTHPTDKHKRKLTKRLYDLIEDCAALKPHLASQVKELSNLVGELVNFGISVCITPPFLPLHHVMLINSLTVGSADNAPP